MHVMFEYAIYIYLYTLAQNENFTLLSWYLLCMGKKHQYSQYGTGIQSYVRVLNFISWGVTL